MTDIYAAIIRLLRNGPATSTTVRDTLASPPPPDRRSREMRAWREAAGEAAHTLADLGSSGQIIRVRTRTDIWWMTTADAEDLLTEVREALDYARSVLPATT